MKLAWDMVMSLGSEKDPRWNCSFETYGSVGTAGNIAEEKVKEMEKVFGTRPDDLKMFCMKY